MVNRKGEDGIAVLLSLFYTLLTLGLVLTSLSGPRALRDMAQEREPHRTDLMQLSEAGLFLALQELRVGGTLERATAGTWSLSYAMGQELWGTVNVELDRNKGVLRSRARVYEQVDPDLPLDGFPNRLLARARGEVGLGRIRFRPPAKAPLVLLEPSGLHIESDLVLLTRQGEAALAYVADGEKAPVIPEGSLAMELPEERLSLERIMGIPREDLATMADRHVPAGEPFVEMQWGLVHLSGERRFDAEHPLQGSGFLVVEGDLILEGDEIHEFQGILLVTGSLFVRGRARIEGMTLVLGDLRVTGKGRDQGLTLQFDEESLRRSLWSVEGLRFSQRPSIVLEKPEDGKAGRAER